jgi:hypothetical protein
MAAMFHPRNDDGDLPCRRSGCPAAEEVVGEHTARKRSSETQHRCQKTRRLLKKAPIFINHCTSA